MSGEALYLVQQNDTLLRIAIRLYGDMAAWRDIARANGLRSPYGLKLGQRLRLPV